MKKNFFIALVLGVSLMACSKSYYPQMYEKAGEDETENILIADDDSIKMDTTTVKEVLDTVKAEVEKVVEAEKIVESTDKYIFSFIFSCLFIHLRIITF